MSLEGKVAKQVAEIPPSGIRKFFDIVSEMKDAISLSVGEPDFTTPWYISESAIYAIEQGYTHYSSNAGLLELRELICQYYEMRFGLSYLPGEVIVTVGASEGIDLALRALVEPGDEIIVPAPSYVSYAPCVRLCGGVPIGAEVKAEDACKLRAEVLESMITPKTKAVIIPYPNNPTGAILTKQELEALAAVLVKHDLVAISDEIYAELTYGRRHVSIASLPGMQERSIVINGFSKAFAMTGWRLGYVMGPSYFTKQMLKIHQYTMLCASSMSQYAGREALRHGLEDGFASVQRMAREYDRRRRYVVARLDGMGLPCFEPEGAFYAFPGIQKTGLSSEAFCERLLREKGVAIVPGTAFGAFGEGYARLSYATALDQIKIALDRMEQFVQLLEEKQEA